MTYKFDISLGHAWALRGSGETADVPMTDLLRLLAAIDATGNIAGACKTCELSYRHAWGILRRFETLFGTPLILTRRRQGTTLSPFAERLVWANRRLGARLTPTLQSMASELQEELAQLLPERMPHLRLHASHGFAVEALMQHVAPTEHAVELRYRTAIEALASLSRGECDLAGFQVPLGAFEAPIMNRYAQWLQSQDVLLIHLAVRNTGLFVQSGNPRQIRGIEDLAREDVRFVNRQIGSSTRYLIGLMLEQAHIPIDQVQGYESNEFTHMAIAAHIASGMADTGVGVETAAARFKLDFIALVRERYFFAIRREALNGTAMQALLKVMRSQAYREYVGTLVGYDATETGSLQTLEQAFGMRRNRNAHPSDYD